MLRTQIRKNFCHSDDRPVADKKCSIRYRQSLASYTRHVRVKYANLITAAASQETLDLQQTRTIRDVYDLLATKAIADSSSRPPNTRYIIGIAGVPGGGKSTLAVEVVKRINKLSGGDKIAVRIPMDGFHYYKRELDAFPDPAEAYKRRGAHWTFDAEAYVTCLANLKTIASGSSFAPSFDHGVGDPKPDDIEITPHHSIVISEGNYLLLEKQPWSKLVNDGILDDTWYIDCKVNVAMNRVYKRQLSNGIDPEVSKVRISTNDRPNALEIEQTKHVAKLLVPDFISFGNSSKRQGDANLSDSE